MNRIRLRRAVCLSASGVLQALLCVVALHSAQAQSAAPTAPSQNAPAPVPAAPTANVRHISIKELALLETLPQPQLDQEWREVAMGANVFSPQSAAWQGVDAIDLDVSLQQLQARPLARRALVLWVSGGGAVLLHTDAARAFGFQTALARERTDQKAGQLFGRARASLPFGAHPLLWGGRSKSLEGQTTGLMGVQLVFYQMDKGDHLVTGHDAGVPLLSVTDLAAPDNRSQYAAAIAPHQRGWAIVLPRRIENFRADGAAFFANINRFLANRDQWVGVEMNAISKAFAQAAPQSAPPSTLLPAPAADGAPPNNSQNFNPQFNPQNPSSQPFNPQNPGAQFNPGNVAPADAIPNVDWRALAQACERAARGEPSIVIQKPAEENGEPEARPETKPNAKTAAEPAQPKAHWNQQSVLILQRSEAASLASSFARIARQLEGGGPVDAPTFNAPLAMLLNLETRRELQSDPGGAHFSPLVSQVMARVPDRRQWLAWSTPGEANAQTRIRLWNGIFALAAAQSWGQHAMFQKPLYEEAIAWWGNP